MKTTEAKKALAGKSPAELQTELEALLKEQFGLRMQAATQQLTNNSKLRSVRRGIARVRTLMHQKNSESQGNDRRTSEDRSTAAAPRKALVQTFIGRVVSDKMNKTVTVLVERRVKHPLYGKIVMQSRKFHAHDENGEAKMGDLVEISATRKLSQDQGVPGVAGAGEGAGGLSGGAGRASSRDGSAAGISPRRPAALRVAEPGKSCHNCRFPGPACRHQVPRAGSKTGRRRRRRTSWVRAG